MKKYQYKPGEIIPKNNYIPPIVVPEIRFKLLVIIEKNLIVELESQAKEGYEVVEILNKQGPGPYSDDTSYKILLRKNNAT